MPRKRSIVVLGLTSALLFAAQPIGSALAANDAGNPGAIGSGHQKTDPLPPVNANQGRNSRQSRNDGVITPPKVHDNGIQATVPAPHTGTLQVIPPPGTAQSKRDLQEN